jgi:class 3 adenylate cyclase
MSNAKFNYDLFERRAGKFLHGTYTVVFLDIVEFTKKGDNVALRKAVRELQNEIGDDFDDLKWDEPEIDNDLIVLPTGDGYGIGFADTVNDERILRDIVRISNDLRTSGVPVRIGINKGACFVHLDANDDINLAGWGIVDAQRVMSCGDRNHILCTNWFASGYQDAHHDPNLHDIKEYKIKGRKLKVYNYYGRDFGNNGTPRQRSR